MSATFVEDFYPTPVPVIAKMIAGLDLHLIEDVLDLGAGRGVIGQYIAEEKEELRYERYGGERPFHVDVVEINPEFHDVLKGKGFRLIHDDILSFETFKIYHLIIANFPFSIGAECLERALALLEQNGGHLRCLLNAETIRNPCTNLRKTLVRRLADLGAEIEYLPGAFVGSDRSTTVEAALIKLHRERPEAPSIILDSLKRAEAQNQSRPGAGDHVVSADFATAMVARFNLEARVGIHLIDEYEAVRPYILDSMKPVAGEPDYSKPLITLEVGGRGNDINNYLAGLREKYWALLINDPRFNRLYTSNVLTELQAKLKELRGYDFTLFNIGELVGEMRGKIVAGIEASILDLFDRFSHKYAYDESIHNGNTHYYNGWKTNKAWKINRRIILPMNGLSAWSGRAKLDYDIHKRLSDMVKVFNYLSPERCNVALLVGNACESANLSGDFNIHLNYFKVKFFKKGTAHITFTDEGLLAKFNIFGSQRKGWLPPAYGKKARQDMDREDQETVESFHSDMPITYEDVVSKPEFFIVEQSGLLLLASGESEAVLPA